jgi:hypothetical protein
MIQVELFFGRNANGVARVSDADWQRFVLANLLPRFAGMTILDAQGVWTDPVAGTAEREGTKLVRIAEPGGADLARRVRDVTEAYKTQFGQKSVGIVTSPVCAAF